MLTWGGGLFLVATISKDYPEIERFYFPTDTPQSHCYVNEINIIQLTW